jgi:thiamine biosynthesis lipoprotein
MGGIAGTSSVRRVLVPLDVPPVARLAASCSTSVLALGGETMGTTWSVKLVPPAHLSAPSLRADIEAVLDRVVGEMSTWISHSDISRFNRAAAGTWHVLPDDFCAVLRYALRLAEESDGACDPTIGALVDLWGFGPSGCPRIIPDTDAIAVARAACGWQRVRLDPGGRALQPGGVRLDLSSVAKGFAVDKVSAWLASCGVADRLVEIGGELAGHGIKPDGQPWWVALEDPRQDNPTTPGILVALHDLAIATSGDSRRRFHALGRYWSHTIDPRSGWPVSEQLASVTVLHRRCMQADALATALLVLGPDDGFLLAERLNLAARFVMRHAVGFEERMTPALADMLA